MELEGLQKVETGDVGEDFLSGLIQSERFLLGGELNEQLTNPRN